MADCKSVTAVTSNRHHPRKDFEDAVKYAIDLSNNHLRLLGRAGSLAGLRYLEIGPGSDFAPQLVLASHGVQVTLADKYIAQWDASYHPGFYEPFLERWTGPSDAIRAALACRSYAGIIRVVPEPCERLASIRANSFDFVLSNAVLEHVSDIDRCAAELARVTSPGGLHCHQVDFRYHKSFDRPLDHLLLGWDEYQRERRYGGGVVHGTMMRMPEMVEIFSRYFWIWDIVANAHAQPDYTDEIRSKLPDDSPYKYWPVQMLRETSGFFWLVRKDKSRRSPFQPRWRMPFSVSR
jgi:SAM-dependent methyltransferase